MGPVAMANTVFLWSDAAATSFSLFVATIQGRRLFPWKVCRLQWWLDKALVRFLAWVGNVLTLDKHHELYIHTNCTGGTEYFSHTPSSSVHCVHSLSLFCLITSNMKICLFSTKSRCSTQWKPYQSTVHPSYLTHLLTYSHIVSFPDLLIGLGMRLLTGVTNI